MNTMDSFGSIPGPYGKPIKVFRAKDRTDDDAFAHDFEGSMDLAGIHDPRQREACFAAINAGFKNGGSISFQVFLDHGGRTVPKALLVKPDDPATLQIPHDPTIREVADNWATLAMDQRDWASRSAALLDVIHGATDEARSWTMAAHDGFEVVHGFALSILITSALEHLTETEIDCLEAAAFYAMTTHEAWSNAGIEWLKPFRRTWFRDWALARPQWQEFARNQRKVNCELPIWIVKGTSA